MAFKLKSGNNIVGRNGKGVMFKKMGSSPLKTHNTGYDDQGRLIRLPHLTEKDEKDHAASIEMESSLSDKELLEKKATDKLIREDNQQTFEENKKKEGFRKYKEEETNKLVEILIGKAMKNNPMLTSGELEKLESSYRKYSMDESTNFRINKRGPHTGTGEYLQMYLDAGGKEFKPRNVGPYGATEEEIRKLNE